MSFDNRTLDVPYGDHFYHSERWFIVAPHENSPRCIFRSHNVIVFLKSTMFKSKIQVRSQEELKSYFQNWLKQIEDLGYLDPSRYAS